MGTIHDHEHNQFKMFKKIPIGSEGFKESII